MTSIEMTRHNVLESKVSRNCNRLQEYLKYRAQEEMEGPRVACAAPSLLSLIPNLASSFTNSAPFASGTSIDTPSAFSVVSSACDKGVTSPFTAFAAATQAAVANQVAAQFGSPTATASQLNTTTTATATLSPTSLASPSSLLYNQLMCLPGILENIRPEILKASMTTTQFKPIPNSERVDLARWRVKEPSDWAMDDVAGWMLDVSKRHGIPCEDINMVKFATLKGMDLLKMTEKDFASCDPNYGSVFYKELLKLMNVSPDDNLIDDVLRKYNKNEEENLVSRELQKQLQQHQQMQNQIFAAHQLSQQLHQAQSFQNLANNICAALSPAVNGLSGLSAALSPTSPLVASQLTQPRLSPLSQDYLSCFQQIPSTSNAEYESDIDVKPCFSKMRDTGKVRKRAQHSKGNKLWEFIRDALKDPSTCPSVVRWEDPAEGVFRIVESEKLARLWGERKNNHKMTYEKLSRAMRYYYNTKILLPVSGRRLVYKFGPNARGWNTGCWVTSDDEIEDIDFDAAPHPTNGIFFPQHDPFNPPPGSLGT